MKLALLFSGGKDSTYAGYLAKKQGHKISCLISVFSANPDSFMFHTPSIEKTKAQAYTMEIPLIIEKTRGEKEAELKDLEKAIKNAKEQYQIQGIITGAVKSVYQASRIQKICDKLNIECINPLWQKSQIELLKELIKNKFHIVVTGIAGYPLTKEWLGRKIDKKFIEQVEELQRKYQINPAGEGGEFETFVLDCPLFKKPMKIIDKKIHGENHAWKMEIEVE